MVEHGEAQRIAAIKKQELHRLALLKQRDHVEEIKLKLGIAELEKKVADEKSAGAAVEEQRAKAIREEKQINAVSEKAKIKAEMARIEEEEHKKLEALKAKLHRVNSPDEEQSEDKAAPAQLRSDQEPAHSDDKQAADAGSSSGKLKSARESNLAACTTDNCDLDKEDHKWLAHRKSVDYYAELARTGHGEAKQRAIRRMKELEHQITHDFHHLTAFADAQEHALPPAPKS